MREQTDQGPAKSIWLHLLRKGEYVPAGVIRKALPTVYFANFAATINDMSHSGTLNRRTASTGKLEYAVTTGCRVPRSVTIGELSSAMHESAMGRDESEAT